MSSKYECVSSHCEFSAVAFFYYYRGRSQWLQITVTAAQQVSSARCGEGNVPFCQLCEEFCILFCQLVFKNLSLFWPGGTKPDTKHSPLLHCHCDSCFFFFFCNCYDSGALALSQLSEGVKTGWKCHRAEQPLITAKVGLTKHLKEQLKKSFFFASSSALSESLPALVLNASSETLFPHFVFVYQHGKDLDPVFQVTLGLIQFLLQWLMNVRGYSEGDGENRSV